SDADVRVRRINADAAKMMRYGGISEEEALKIITYSGAIQLGVQDKVGSLEVGKDADIGIWNAHPLSVYASVDQTIIDGKVYFDKQKDQQMRQQLANERTALER